MAFGRLLRDKRKQGNLSQAGLAHKTGWPQTTVSRVEQGTRSVTLSELLQVACVFGVSASDLLAELPVYETANSAGAVREPAASYSFNPGFAAAYADESAMLSQLARYGVRFLGVKVRPALAALPLEETILAALRYATEPRIFEALPGLLISNSEHMDWGKLVSGAYSLQLQNRLGMAVAAAMQLKGLAKGTAPAVWSALKSAHEALAGGKLDREEVLGVRPKTPEALALLHSRTPAWLAFWHGLGSADPRAFVRYLKV